MNPHHGSRDWSPKYPDIAISPEEGLYDAPGSGGTPYETSPATSHVYGWKLLSGGFVSKFYGPSVGAPSGTRSVLTVAFKPPAVGGTCPNQIASEYEYYFTDPLLAQKYLDDFRGAEHPGFIVQELIDNRIPYKRKH